MYLLQMGYIMLLAIKPFETTLEHGSHLNV